MNTEITRKQAILLTVLGALLVVVCFVQFLLRPVLGDIKEFKASAAELEKQYETLVEQSNSYDRNLESLAGWEEKNAEETKLLYPLCDAQRIDNILTRVSGMFGAHVTSLTISDLNQYYLDAEGNLILANPQLVEASEDGTTPAEMETTGYTPTGEYCRDFSYTLEGNYEDITEMLTFVNDVSFFGIKDLTITSQNIPKAEAQVFYDESGNVIPPEPYFDEYGNYIEPYFDAEGRLIEPYYDEYGNYIEPYYDESERLFAPVYDENGFFIEYIPAENGLDDYYSFTITITAYMYKSPVEAIEPLDSEEIEAATEAAAS